MLEQEIASIIKFILEAAENPTPYYYNVPQDFCVPAVYFPVPEILTGGDTFQTYYTEYSWYIKFFHKTTQEAYQRALKAITSIKEHRNLIPLIDKNGNNTGSGIRIADPLLKIVDDGAAQLEIYFTSRRPYKQTDAEKMQTFEIFDKLKNDYKEDL